MIIPTGATDSRMTTAKRQSLADFLYYSLCTGQTKAGDYGYSPLPLNLVTAGFSQIAQLKKADPAVDLTDRDVTTCNNPTFDGKNPNKNLLAEIAPPPAACDEDGRGPVRHRAPVEPNARPDADQPERQRRHADPATRRHDDPSDAGRHTDPNDAGRDRPGHAGRHRPNEPGGRLDAPGGDGPRSSTRRPASRSGAAPGADTSGGASTPTRRSSPTARSTRAPSASPR